MASPDEDGSERGSADEGGAPPAPPEISAEEHYDWIDERLIAGDFDDPGEGDPPDILGRGHAEILGVSFVPGDGASDSAGGGNDDGGQTAPDADTQTAADSGEERPTTSAGSGDPWGAFATTDDPTDGGADPTPPPADPNTNP